MRDREVKRRSTEMLILALVEDWPRHGYEIAKLIEKRFDGGTAIPHGVALPIALSAGETRLDQRSLGRVSRATPAPVLQAHASRQSLSRFAGAGPALNQVARINTA